MLKAADIHHPNSPLDEAALRYRKMVAQNPGNAEALHVLGVIEAQRGDLTAALEFLDQATGVNPESAILFSDRGNILQMLKRYDEALVSCERALAIQPDYAEAHNNHGNALQELNRLDEALASYDRALAIRPGYAEALNNRGHVLQKLTRYDEALASYARALAAKPDFAVALNNRGTTLRELKRFDEALASFDRTLAVQPSYAEAHNDRGITLRALKRLDAALASFDRALAIRPDYVEAHNNRGNVLRELKRFDEALGSFDRALVIRPDYAAGHNNRGAVLQKLKRYDEALASFDRALAISPDYADVHTNRGNVLRELNRYDEALASYDRTVEIRPGYAEGHNNRGAVLQELKRFDEALASFERAVAIEPGHAEFLYNRGTLNFRLGRLREGWPDYEWRWDRKNFASSKPPIRAAKWQGEDIHGRSILIHFEQGRGDIIQFARYLPTLAQRGAKVTFLVPAELGRLIGSMNAQVTFTSSLPEESFDFQCALMSLPLRFGTDVPSIPSHVPYLRAEPDLVALWKTRISENDFKIGIAWQGSPQSDTGRDIPLVEFASLSGLSGTRLISLQKHYGLKQLADLPPSARIHTLGEGFDDGPDAFIDTAAVMENLDLIITSDTAIAHLAGALARPTWVALKHVPEWRWMLDRSDSPWYPTMRLFRQDAPGDWNSVFVKIAKELRNLPG